MTTLTAAEQDVIAEQDIARWQPSPEAITAAVAAIAAAKVARPGRWLAAVALVQPGKQMDWWQVGQTVEQVPGVWVGINSFDDPQSYATARNLASEAAAAQLGDRPGTVAWATIGSDGNAHVYEDSARTA